VLTNCTFDGLLITRTVMEECLPIKPDLMFLWTSMVWNLARWSPVSRRRTRGEAALVGKESRIPAYRAAYKDRKEARRRSCPKDKSLLETRRSPTRTQFDCGSTKQIPLTNQCLAFAARIDGAREVPGLPHRRRTLP